MSICTEIHSFIAENFFVEDFGDDDSFLGTGLIDSTGMMELVAFLEEHYGIAVEDRELVPANLDSVSLAAAFVGRKRASRAA